MPKNNMAKIVWPRPRKTGVNSNPDLEKNWPRTITTCHLAVLWWVCDQTRFQLGGHRARRGGPRPRHGRAARAHQPKVLPAHRSGAYRNVVSGVWLSVALLAQDMLLGDSSKAQKLLGWKPQVTFQVHKRQEAKLIFVWNNAPRCSNWSRRWWRPTSSSWNATRSPDHARFSNLFIQIFIFGFGSGEQSTFLLPRLCLWLFVLLISVLFFQSVFVQLRNFAQAGLGFFQGRV